MSKYNTDALKVSYGVGRQLGTQLRAQPFEGLNVEAIANGVKDAFEGIDDAIPADQMQAAFEAIRQQLEASQAQQFEQVKVDGEAYLADNGKREDVQVTESGLQYEIVEQGNGETPSQTSTVRVHYKGTLLDGSQFDSSYDRGQPAEFPVGGVIAGWTEALLLMPVGSKWKLTIPHNLAYGTQGAGEAIGPYQTLKFDIELLDIL